MAGSEYDVWADYYDVVHTGLPGEAEFYVGQGVRLGTETLELGCGTGRIGIPMAMSGVRVVGVDHSRRMLEYCREKMTVLGDVSGRLNLIEGDMRGFAFARDFGLIIMPYRTFMHLLTAEERGECLECVYRHLRSEGRFILNLWAGDGAGLPEHWANREGALVFAGRYALPESEGELVHFVASTCDRERQLIVEEHVLQEVTGEGAVVHTAVLPMRRAWVTYKQMLEALTAAGFQIEAVFGDFDCAQFTPDSTEMIWVARK